MRLDQALPKLLSLKHRPLVDVLDDLPTELRVNKGNVGQLIETYLGLRTANQRTDFTDGELKSTKTRGDGKPAETIFIMQISSVIDEMLSHPPQKFEKTDFFKKVRNLILVQVVKVGPETNWRFGDVFHVNVSQESDIFDQIKSDYYRICSGLLDHTENSEDGFIHTTNGGYVQVRSKDSKPYHPIYSERLGRNISNKNHAFYFKKEFHQHLIDQAIHFSL